MKNYYVYLLLKIGYFQETESSLLVYEIKELLLLHCLPKDHEYYNN